jgi:hypothetical protein
MSPVDRLIQLLQLLKSGKHQFLYPLEVSALENYLNGFRGACSASGHEIPRKLRALVVERRGWKHSAAGPALQMKAKDMTDEAMMDELIEIEIELLRALAQ